MSPTMHEMKHLIHRCMSDHESSIDLIELSQGAPYKAALQGSYLGYYAALRTVRKGYLIANSSQR